MLKFARMVIRQARDVNGHWTYEGWTAEQWLQKAEAWRTEGRRTVEAVCIHARLHDLDTNNAEVHAVLTADAHAQAAVDGSRPQHSAS
jgi:hypothetical protein